MCIYNAAFSDKSIIGLRLDSDKSFQPGDLPALAISDEKALSRREVSHARPG
jgi:hypothetical protein